jgi:hypothetical protein
MQPSSKLFSFQKPRIELKLHGNRGTIKLSFRVGGRDAFFSLLESALRKQSWEVCVWAHLLGDVDDVLISIDCNNSNNNSNNKTQYTSVTTSSLPAPPTSTTTSHTTSNSSGNALPTHSSSSRLGGISGIKQSMSQQAKERDTTINQAFTDIDALMDNAKPLVELAKRFALEQDKCSDEKTKVALNDLLINMGIMSPVTKYDHASTHTRTSMLHDLIDAMWCDDRLIAGAENRPAQCIMPSWHANYAIFWHNHCKFMACCHCLISIVCTTERVEYVWNTTECLD